MSGSGTDVAQAGDAPTVVGATVDVDVVAMLDLLAGTIVDALGFGVAAVNIARPDGSLEVVSVAGDEDARRTLLGSVDSAETWDTMLAVSEPWGMLRFADHRSGQIAFEVLAWVPAHDPDDPVVTDDEDAWHPEDALFAPLTGSDGSRIGILSVDLPHDGRRPGPATRKALEAFAVSTALAIEHATLRARAEASERRYRELATRDQLTGVGNRSMLRDRLEHALAARAQQTPMALVFIDLDGFKAVNDDYSHAAGDHLLTTLAARISAAVRPHDTVVRWGGDEFLVLLETLDSEDAVERVAERIRTAVARPVLHDGHEMRVTASVGTAVRRPGDVFDADEFVRRADTAMYDAKDRAPHRRPRSHHLAGHPEQGRRADDPGGRRHRG